MSFGPAPAKRQSLITSPWAGQAFASTLLPRHDDLRRRLGLGIPVEESQVLRFLDRGGNFIDTANGYTKGHSETIIGDCFNAAPGKRDRVVIATKFGTNLYRGDPNGGGAGRKAVVAACEQSLRRLHTDYIDLYWMHFWDPLTPIKKRCARARRPGAGRQSPLHRCVGYAGVEGGPGTHGRAAARLDAVHRAAD